MFVTEGGTLLVKLTGWNILGPLRAVDRSSNRYAHRRSYGEHHSGNDHHDDAWRGQDPNSGAGDETEMSNTNYWKNCGLRKCGI